MARKRSIQELAARDKAFGKRFEKSQDRATVEVQLDRQRIYCRICNKSQPLPKMTEMKVQYLGSRGEPTHIELRTIVEKFKKTHRHA